MIRKPLVAGQFYPASPGALLAQVEKFMPPEADEQAALLAMAPHAGYIYSGALAGRVFSQVQVPRQVLLIGPNHSGRGARIALAHYSAWQTPLGEVPTSGPLNEHLLAHSDLISADNEAHNYEHSLEVELPFLQVKQKNLNISALSLGRLNWPQIEALAQDISRAIRALGQPVLMVASTDMNHYLNAQITEKLDALALEQVLALNPGGLCQVVGNNKISMCGVLAVAVSLQAALNLGANQARLVGYSHSGMASGDNTQVVGYAGAIVWS